MMFIITFLNYSVLHTTRSMWSSATKDIQKVYGFSTQQLALVDTWFLLAYSIGVMFLSQIADKFQKRKIIIVMYTIVALLTASTGMCMWIPVEKQESYLWLYCLIKVFNGLAQSPGWAVNLVILSNWFPRTGRGMLVGLWASNCTFGDLVGAQIYKHITSAEADEQWGNGFFVAGALVFVIGIANYFLLVEKPSDIGLLVKEGGVLDKKNSP